MDTTNKLYHTASIRPGSSKVCSPDTTLKEAAALLSAIGGGESGDVDG